MDPQRKTLKTAAKLHTLILVKGINTSRTDKVVMCGTGVTAVVVDTVLELVGMIEVKR